MTTQLVPQEVIKGRVVVPAISLDGHESPQMIVAFENGLTHCFDACGLPMGHLVSAVIQLMFDEPVAKVRRGKAEPALSEVHDVPELKLPASQEQEALFRHAYDNFTPAVRELLDALLESDEELTEAQLRRKCGNLNEHQLAARLSHLERKCLQFGVHKSDILNEYHTNDMRMGRKFGLKKEFRKAVLPSASHKTNGHANGHALVGGHAN